MKTISRSLASFVTAGLAALALGLPAAAAESGRYAAVSLERDGRAPEATLDRMIDDLRPELAARSARIVVLIHGFDTSYNEAARDYSTVARRLRQQSGQTGDPFAVVGVHWASDPGSRTEWMTRAFAHRLTSLLGMQRAVKNPYIETWHKASQVGRTGARAVLLRLQREFPGHSVNVLAHSLGSEVLVSALAPEGSVRRSANQAIEQPERELHLGLVALVGADLDHDALARNRAALDRAKRWWITVPGEARADAALELRKAARRSDAVGNRGLSLAPDDLTRLNARQALTFDRGNVPTGHAFNAYFNERRVEALARALNQDATPAPAMAVSVEDRAG